MNGIPRSRRASKPIRVTLAKQLGRNVDGAWWPHTASVAGELPDLVGALHRALGEIVDIRVNWSATEGQLDLETIATGARLHLAGEHHRRPRLMFVAGRMASAKILVVPSLTSQALGLTMLRAAAGLITTGAGDDTRNATTALAVLGLAEAESSRWCASVHDVAAP